MAPKVSINLCCYNSEQFLAETLKSIEGQTFRDWELVVINDGSADRTESMVLEFKERGFPVVYCFQENKGLGYSRNKALELSTGEYITFIDHDDLWLPEKLEKQVAVFDSRDDVDFIYSNYFIQKDGQKKLASKDPQPEGDVFDRFLKHNPVCVITAAIRKKALEGIGEDFDTTLRLCEEYDLFLRLLFHSRAFYIAEPLAVYRIHPERASIKFVDGWSQEMEYIIEKYKKALEGFEQKYGNTLQYVYGKIGYYRARVEMLEERPKKARECLRPYLGVDFKFLLLYLITFLPASVWHRAVSIRSKGYLDTL